MIRTGEDYRASIRDGRAVLVGADDDVAEFVRIGQHALRRDHEILLHARRGAHEQAK